MFFMCYDFPKIGKRKRKPYNNVIHTYIVTNNKVFAIDIIMLLFCNFYIVYVQQLQYFRLKLMTTNAYSNVNTTLWPMQSSVVLF